MTVYEGKYPPTGTGKIAIVVSKYNKPITERLLDGALAKLKEGGVRDVDIDVVWVPGAFEIPMMAQRLAFDEEYQGVICLGCVIKGETTHDEHINRMVSMQLGHIAVEASVPVAFGILTCNTVEQAEARSTPISPNTDKTSGEVLGNKGIEAATAMLEMLDLLSQLPEPESNGEHELIYSILNNVKRYQEGDFDGEDSSYDEYDDEFPCEYDDEEYERRGHHGRRHFSRDFSPREHKSSGYKGFDHKKGEKHSYGSRRFRREGKGGSDDDGRRGKFKFSKKGK
ncbi:MAG: 6,7-dimethyl-8-ribityllumazine synthase [Thermoguttaceae bacterium]|jgi:6,7-dimethyl-8-ribityllumazine synthase